MGGGQPLAKPRGAAKTLSGFFHGCSASVRRSSNDPSGRPGKANYLDAACCKRVTASLTSGKVPEDGFRAQLRFALEKTFAGGTLSKARRTAT